MTLTSSLHDAGTLDAAARERARVHAHLAGAESSARRRRPQLEPLAALCRLLLLDELSRYRRLGRYPRNPARNGKPVPQFIDAHGTRCAVAHLMEISGQAELVHHIARTENAARVRTLSRLPELRAWLAAAGLSVDEAARIQPEYCYLNQAAACFCAGDLEGVAVGTVVAVESGYVRMRADRIEGVLPDLSVGSEALVATQENAQVPLGSRIFAGYSESYSVDVFDAPTIRHIGQRLTIDGGSVTCSYDGETARRPVGIDTAIEAFMAGRDGCVGVLANDDSAWNEKRCDGDEASSAGCTLAHPSGIDLPAAELTSAALLIALLLHRRGRP